MSSVNDTIISVIGLGYVGLPVAVHMASKFRTIGYDINTKRVEELKNFQDHTLEVTTEELKQASLKCTSDIQEANECNFHIVAVPTPVTNANIPNLTALKSATKDVGQILKKGDIVVFESTVFPGATEDVCLPILLSESGLKTEDFSIGYSPERINPGDKEHSFTKIKKVVSGDSQEALNKIAEVYGSVVEAGVFKSSSIKVAEAAKVIENTQRDINIALMNELTIICDKLDISVYEVLEAAGTKWNFLKFTPGLVGGHCIGVDPYYLTYKATQLGCHPEVILSGRKINDHMPQFITQKLIKTMVKNSHAIRGETINVLGLTFKENCPDLRNTKVADIIHELKDYGMKVNVCDPHALSEEALKEYGLELTPCDQLPPAAITLVAVKHSEFENLSPDNISSELIFDLKGIYSNYQGQKKIYTL